MARTVIVLGHGDNPYAAPPLPSASWSTPVTLFNGADGDGRLQVTGSTLVAVGRASGASNLSRRASTDGGASWSSGVDKTPTAHVLYEGFSVATNGDLMWAYTASSRPWFTRSTDAGVNWSTPVQISSDATDVPFRQVLTTGEDGVLHMALLNSGATASRYYRSDDGGDTWDRTVVPNQSYSALLAENGIVHLAWTDPASNAYDLHYRRSTNNGVSWGSDTFLVTKRLRPYLVRAGASLCIFVEGGNEIFNFPRDQHIWCLRSTDNGLTWKTPILAAEMPSSSRMLGHPVPVVDVEGRIHVCFMEHDNVTGDIANANLRMVTSLDEGRTWSAFETVTGLGQAVSFRATATHLHVLGFTDGSMAQTSNYTRRAIT